MDIAAMQQRLEPLFPGLMGVRLLELTPERMVAEMAVRPDLCTAGGILHGGAVMAFADTLGAVGTVLNRPPGTGTTTTDSSTKFIPGTRAGTVVRGESVALHRGRSTMVRQTSITGDDGDGDPDVRAAPVARGRLAPGCVRRRSGSACRTHSPRSTRRRSQADRRGPGTGPRQWRLRWQPARATRRVGANAGGATWPSFSSVRPPSGPDFIQ
jgi:uncharacterized protein (TIGR00369 family)